MLSMIDFSISVNLLPVLLFYTGSIIFIIDFIMKHKYKKLSIVASSFMLSGFLTTLVWLTKGLDTFGFGFLVFIIYIIIPAVIVLIISVVDNKKEKK